MSVTDITATPTTSKTVESIERVQDPTPTPRSDPKPTVAPAKPPSKKAKIVIELDGAGVDVTVTGDVVSYQTVERAVIQVYKALGRYKQARRHGRI